MMVETCLECPQDLGSNSTNGMSLPQWKREILQRRAARASAPPRAAVPPPPQQPQTLNPVDQDEEEELRYGPGIVKRLKSRYLSLALRDAPKRRPSLLRRATSLEHLLEEPPKPPQPAPRQARPPAPARPVQQRRESIKRARSVDALARVEGTSRPPRRPTPLLSENERPPPDVVRAALRKFEGTTRKPPVSARVAAVVRGRAVATQTARPNTPEPRLRTPSPATPVDEADEKAVRIVSRAALEGIAKAGNTFRYSFEHNSFGSHLPTVAAANPVMLARARLSPSPRRIGVIKPMPAPQPPPLPSPPPRNVNGEGVHDKNAEIESKVSVDIPVIEIVTSRIEEIVIIVPNDSCDDSEKAKSIDSGTVSPTNCDRDDKPDIQEIIPKLNGNVDQKPPISPPWKVSKMSEGKIERSWQNIVQKEQSEERSVDTIDRNSDVPEFIEVKHRILDLKESKKDSVKEKTDIKKDLISPTKENIERTIELIHRNGDYKETNGVVDKFEEVLDFNELLKEKEIPLVRENCQPKEKIGINKETNGDISPTKETPIIMLPRKPRPPPPSANSIVFNFSNRKEVPDYIENDGLIIRNKKDKLKASDSGVAVLRAGAGQDSSEDEDGDSEGGAAGPPSPCRVQFVNDNVLINGRSSMPARPNKDRISKLKLQFDDSLTTTFEYPSEASFCEEPGTGAGAETDAPCAPATPPHNQFTQQSHIGSVALARYTPSKTAGSDAFELGVTRLPAATSTPTQPERVQNGDGSPEADTWGETEWAAARHWSADTKRHTDLLF